MPFTLILTPASWQGGALLAPLAFPPVEGMAVLARPKLPNQLCRIKIKRDAHHRMVLQGLLYRCRSERVKVETSPKRAVFFTTYSIKSTWILFGVKSKRSW